MTYYFLAADGSTGGPETLEALTGMVAGGSVSLATLVVPAGGEDWTPLARVLRYFYSDASGATAGPVAFSELQRLNQTGVLDQNSWVLEEGAEQWKTLSSVITAGGAEVYVPAPVAAPVPAGGMPRTATGAYRPPGGRTQAVAADPYAAPRSSTVPHKVMVRHRRTGGIGRLNYFLYAVILPMVLAFMMIAFMGGAALFSDGTSAQELQDLVEKSMIAFSIVALLLTVAGVIFAIQRLKNIGWPWYFIFISLIPIVSIWFSLALLAYPPGYAHHKRFDTAAKVICGLFVFFIIAGIVMFFVFSKKPAANVTGVMEGIAVPATITKTVSCS